MKNKSDNKTIPTALKITLISLIIVVVCLFYIVFSLSSRIVSIGQNVGSLLGETEGRVSGGMQGFKDGTEEGKRDGLNANDITVTIDNGIVLSGNIQIQNTSFEYVDLDQIGEDFAALTSVNASIIYSVDLNNATIEQKENEVTVTIDKILGEISLGEQQKVDTWSRNKNSGSVEDYLVEKDSNKVIEEIRQELDNSLEQDSIKTAAKEQITCLVENLYVSDIDVIVNVEESAIIYEY